MRSLKLFAMSFALLIAGFRGWNKFAPPLGASVQVSAVDASGHAVPGAKLELVDDNGAWCTLTIFTPVQSAWDWLAGQRAVSPRSATATADAEGKATIGPVNPGPHELRVASAGLTGVAQVQVGDQTLSQQVRLEPASVLSGAVHSGDGAAAVGAVVHAKPSRSSEVGATRHATTDEHGAFRLELPKGSYVVWVVPPSGIGGKSITVDAPHEGLELSAK